MTSMLASRAVLRAPVDDPPSLCSHVIDLFLDAKEGRRSLVGQWKRNYQILHNKAWGARATWLPSPAMADIWPIVASRVSWMTDQRPTFDITPFADPMSQYSNYLSQLADDLRVTLYSSWMNNKFSLEIAKVLWDAHTYGIGFFKTLWSPTAGGGLGDVLTTRVDPFTFYPDPTATSMEDANYFIEVRTLSLQEIERRWPGWGKKLSPEGSNSEQAPTQTAQNPSSLPRANPGALSPATSAQYGLPGQTTRLQVPLEGGVQVVEAWLREPVRKADDGKLQYDTWRVVVVAQNQVIMNESALELWEHGQHPYDRFVEVDTGEFWGQSLVELLTPPQISINRLLASLEHSVELHGDPVFVEDNRTGLARTTITNQPGTRLTKNAGSSAEWLSPPPFPASLTADLVRFYKSEMENISGLSAVVRGFSPQGRNAQGVIDSVQDAAFVRIRGALRELEGTLQSVGHKQAALVCEFYDTPRLIATVGPQGEQQVRALTSEHFYLAGPDGKAPMRYQISIEAGSSLPTSKQARAAEANNLFALGAIDGEALLDAHDWPNRQQITARVREMQASAGTLGMPPTQRAAARR